LTDANHALSVSDAAADARPQSFALTEMVACEICQRRNPPTRANCLYCAAILPAPDNAGLPEPERAPAAESNPTLDVDSGFYVVLAAPQTGAIDESSLVEIAGLLNFSTAEVESAMNLGGPAPLLRAARFGEATQLNAKLQALGIEADIIPADALNLELPTQKIRALEFSDTDLTATLLTGRKASVPWSDLILIVSGHLLINRKERKERQRRGRSKPVDSRELFSDEPLIDLYMRSGDQGWRISPGGFDFSCLGSEKAMTAFENLATLVKLLRVRAPHVEVDDAYHRLRPVLANVWPLESQTKKGEPRRSGVGKVDVNTITTTDNEVQFQSYSRLRQWLKMRALEGDR
jgi:hypothetical protein